MQEAMVVGATDEAVTRKILRVLIRKALEAGLSLPHKPNQTLRAIMDKVLDRVLESGVSLRELAEQAEVDYGEMYRSLRRVRVYSPRRSHSKISDDVERQIEKLLMTTDLTRREIASRLGVSKGSVDQRALRLRAREVRLVSQEVLFSNRPHRCPTHGVVAYTPCPACEASGKISQ